MTDASRALLRQLLVSGYSELRSRLAQRLGSTEQAEDALHDTWLRLETATPQGPLRYPQSYLFRIAYNLALNSRRGTRRTISLEEMRDVLDIPHDAPSPETIAEGTADILMLKKAVAELTKRQRVVLLAHRLKGISTAELAKRFQVSQRSIERDLRHAVLHCARATDKILSGMSGRTVSRDHGSRETVKWEISGDDNGLEEMTTADASTVSE